MSDNITSLSCREFTEALAGSAPVPGGGGAAALAGAIGTALGNMVGSLTLGKKKYADVQEEITELKAKADILQKELLEMVDEDARAFEPLSKAYGLPTDTEEQKAEKDRVMETALKTAAMAPLHIMELGTEALELIGRFAEIGSRLAISDAGCAAALCRAAIDAASLNVFINTRLMKDRDTAEELNVKAEKMLSEGNKYADVIFAEVRDRLR